MKLLITGAAGYIGGMLVERFAAREDVDEIICLDRKPINKELRALSKVLYIHANTADDTWQEVCRERAPDVVIHCAWQIRELYGRPALQRRWNIHGSQNIISFAQSVDSVKKFIFLSTVAVYGAYPDNN
ncbi:MAG: NAD-dependent epimerase/dehydratase family protein, partial [Patescibacteria group bacterium]